jgi:sugar-phosphatase
MPEFQCEAMLFDLDGVLVDSMKSVNVVWAAWSEENGIPPSKTLGIIHGRRTMEAIQLLAPHLDPKSEAEKLESAITHKKGGTVAIPGAAKLLHSLPPDRWCVVTSGLKEFAKVRLKGAGLPVPEILVSAEDVFNGKPHPEPYLKGAQLLNVNPVKCMVVEDALNGIEAGRAAGMVVIGVATTYSAFELKNANAVAKNLEEIAASYKGGVLMVRVKTEVAPSASVANRKNLG